MGTKFIHRSILAFAMSIGGFASPVLAATPFMQPAGDTAPPIGHVQYCQENTADCERTFKTAPSVALTISGWRELNDINYTVNTLIQPVTDQEQYQRPEHWTIPTFMGDCEDYVLLKRHMLHKAGWPLNALLITVVRDEKGDGHAVLTVRTDRGDLILDNQAEHIVTWDHTPYRYVKRQSEHHAGQWTAIRDIRPMAGQKVARR